MGSNSRDSFKEKHKHWKLNIWIGIIAGTITSVVYGTYFAPAYEGIVLTVASSVITILGLWGMATLGFRFRAKYYGNIKGKWIKAIVALVILILILIGLVFFIP